MRFASLRLRSLALVLASASLTPACGDDDDGETGAETTPTTTTTTATTTDADPSSTTATTLEGSTGSSSSADTTAADADDTTTGSEGDPTYPPIDGGSCPGGTAPVTLPGASLCAPFCGNAQDMCPAAATGDAPAQCTPFAGPGGSGDPCDDTTPCAATEVCSPGGTCSDVAFWACQLLCEGGPACPDGMVCSGIGTCGYP